MLVINLLIDRFLGMNKYFSILFICCWIAETCRSQVDQLVELKSIIPHVRYELKYATKNNLTGKRIYPKKTKSTYLVKDAAVSLQKIAEELIEYKLGILIWDAYRPYRSTVKFWKIIHDERYVAHPSKGSGHNRGIAVDLSLFELSTGKMLEMPTGFDNFSDTAHHDFTSLSDTQIKNRIFLKEIMEKHGFRSFQTEWWHYSWPNDRGYEILNSSFKKLKKRIDGNTK